ncbi:MAG: hypothetical protein JOZ90_06115 [Alphaproteobacteria bacterium]|nr:hypothetical protein [Alphaproteobacteria bacterium]MBV9372721.1 hypothetical protein [Alphaproteobacteria bacterium]MBV9900654.1 hypothetical protein [Alphaproteobacteria bacterium]
MDENRDEHVQPQDEAHRNSPKAAAGDEAGTANAAAGAEAAGGHEACYWNDKKYSDGATVCDAHTRYKCWNGKWVEIGLC